MSLKVNIKKRKKLLFFAIHLRASFQTHIPLKATGCAT
jgi:hypothetical protein